MSVLHGFNPTMVRLLLNRHSFVAAKLVGFNPTMVRLLQGTFLKATVKVA